MNLMCPHCGWRFDYGPTLVPPHAEIGRDRVAEFFDPLSLGIPRECPGVGQAPRNALSDNRPLWKDGGVK